MIYFKYLRAVVLSSLAALPVLLTVLYFDDAAFNFQSLIGTIIAILTFSAAGCILLGIPIHLVLQKKAIESRIAYLLAGFFSPILIMILGAIVTMNWAELYKWQNIQFTCILALVGACVALAFRACILD